MDTSRILVFDHADGFVCELLPHQIFERTRTEQVNGEHSLEITTTQVLEEEQRLLTCDATGKWREYVVMGTDASHASGEKPIGTYYAVWSLQHDFQGFTLDIMPGTSSAVSASAALAAILGGTSRWTLGTVTQASSGGASMWFKSGWEALSILVDTWGGEIDATISVGTTGVTSREVDLYAHLGQETVTRRFDYGADVTSIKRKVSDDVKACRIIPRGKGEETESGGYGRKITIEDVNDGKNYLQNDSTAPLYRLPDGNGGWEYPTIVVENPKMETADDLLAWAQDVLESYTTPKVTYTATVLQLAEAGLDAHGVQLGDEVQVVDRKFYDDGLRLTARVVKLVVDELDASNTKVTLGNISDSLSDQFTSMQNQLSALNDQSGAWNAASEVDYTWLNTLIANLNAAYNNVGTYRYSSFERGDIWSSVPLDEDGKPTESGGWAMNINGRGFRLANGTTSSGDWDWRTFGDGDGFTADEINTGIVKGGNSYWNLTTGEFYLSGKVSSTTQANITIVGARTNAWYTAWKTVKARFTGDGLLLESTAPIQTSYSDSSTTDYTADYITLGTGVLDSSDDYESISDTSYAAGTDALMIVGDKAGTHLSIAALGTDYLNAFGKKQVLMRTKGQLYWYADTSSTRKSMGTMCMRIGCPSTSQGYTADNQSTITLSGDPLVLERYAGTTSDRRLKTHIAYAGDEAVEFVRNLKPAIFVKDARTEAGFYAQDVQEAVQASDWLPDPVTSIETEDGDSRLILDYEALIAPIVSYCQHLESRIAELESKA